MDPDVAVQARGLGKRFGHVTAVANVDLIVPRGCFFGVVSSSANREQPG